MNDGGPAFPFPAAFNTELGIMCPTKGMSLRDYFAAKAMQELLSQVLRITETMDSITDKVKLFQGISPSAYELADQMIAVGYKHK